ncbi:Allantoicase [Pestalotiopsis sp. IQ-011]
MPFRDDTSLVAFRYDQAAQAEPPIPIPPAKSPLRYQRQRAIAAAAAAAAAAAKRPTSCVSPATTPTAAALTPAVVARTPSSPVPVSVPACSSSLPVIVAPPHPPPSAPLPLPPTEEHPALRSAAPRSDNTDDSKRDSGHAPTTTSTSSRARTFYEDESSEEEEDEDPFPYEKIQPSIRRSKFVPALLVPPLRIRSSSPTSLYAQTQQTQQTQQQQQQHNHIILENGLGGTNNHSESSIPLHSPGLSEANTVSPTSPTTPPPNFPDKTTSTSSSLFSRRSFSFRTSGSSSMKSSRRLKKKKKSQEPSKVVQHPLVFPSEALAEARNEEPSSTPDPAAPTAPTATLPLLDGAKATTSSSAAPVTLVAPPRNGDEQLSSRDQAYHHTRLPGALSSSRLVTAADDSAAYDQEGDDFADFVQQISFSKRGSIMLGGMRPSRHAAPAANMMSPSSPEQRPQRVFPLASPPRIKPNQDNAAALTNTKTHDSDKTEAESNMSPTGRTATPPLPLAPPTPPSAPYAAADAPTTPKSARHPPSIRLISVQVERESQKVRSLYEPGEVLRWEDGAPPASSHGERLEPTVEVPSDVDENSYGFLDYPASRFPWPTSNLFSLQFKKAKSKPQHKYNTKSGRSTWSPAATNWDPRVRGAFCVATR